MAYMVHATIFADMLTDLKAYSDTERGRILTAMLEYMETGDLAPGQLSFGGERVGAGKKLPGWLVLHWEEG